MPEKLVSKEDANYKVSGEDEALCANCANFISPDACKLVHGAISEKGTCELFEPKTDGMELMDILFGGDNG